MLYKLSADDWLMLNSIIYIIKIWILNIAKLSSYYRCNDLDGTARVWCEITILQCTSQGLEWVKLP